MPFGSCALPPAVQNFSSANVPCAHSPSSVAPLHAVPYRFRDHGLNNNGFPHTTRTLTYMTYSSALVWYLYSVVFSIFQPNHRIAKQDLHRAKRASRLGGVVEQKRSVMRFGVAREYPCEAILILGKFKIHGLCIILDNLGDQFDGVPPLTFTFCGERDPLHLEVGLHGLFLVIAFCAFRHDLVEPGFGVFDQADAKLAFFFFAVESGAGVEQFVDGFPRHSFAVGGLKFVDTFFEFAYPLVDVQELAVEHDGG